MEIVLNGRAREIAGAMTITDLIRSVDLDPAYVVVEHNREALERKRYDEVMVADGDRVELVRAVAGG